MICMLRLLPLFRFMVIIGLNTPAYSTRLRITHALLDLQALRVAALHALVAPTQLLLPCPLQGLQTTAVARAAAATTTAGWAAVEAAVTTQPATLQLNTAACSLPLSLWC